MIIVYSSKYGHTAQYAKMLANELNLKSYELNEAKEKFTNNEEIIYLGWNNARKIMGYDKAKQHFKIMMIGLVGLTPKNDDILNGVINCNHVTSPIFYLRGGMEYNRLSFIDKIKMKSIINLLAKATKTNKAKIIEDLNHNYISKDLLDDMINYYNKKAKAQ